ncbi:Gx transporter family protein [Clostridium sp. D2Q-11]|uniref:Gx transporter family protein n=1 Tax=Anaeromonas frigoriresistens TaxID=2683708 RepID=A0A942UTJ3_9FIRM|nr:Gx transporter family protein [Anaeromonas frigoriresistens]MBS4538878.1 Gx transporter family protein [Anaeromonas frigoriresistens]
MSKTQKLVIISLLVAQALVLHLVERMIPFNFGIPGAKLGLANIITLVSLYLFGFKETLTVVVLRTLMANLLGGNVSGFLFSISGGLLSFFIMYLIKRIAREKVSVIGLSIVGAVFHNIGQILMAAFVIHNLNIVIYLPALLISAVATGLFVGITVNYILKFLKMTGLFKIS